MKKIILLYLFSLLSIGSFAQGNLQFIGAKYIKFNKTFNYIPVPEFQIYDSLIVVPDGKVWKIESAGANNKSGNSDYSSSTLDGVRIGLKTIGSSSGTFPIWLPAGSYRLGVSALAQNETRQRFTKASQRFSAAHGRDQPILCHAGHARGLRTK